MALKFDATRKAPYIDLGRGIHLAVDDDEYEGDERCVQKAREELRECPEIVETGLRELRVLLQSEPNLKLPINDDAFLKKFLRPKKYYADSAFDQIKGFYKTKANKDFVLDNLTYEAIRVALEEKVVQVLPKRDQHGRRIIYMELGSKWNCKKVPIAELVRVSHGLLSILSQEPLSQLHGFVFITNFDQLKAAHIRQFSVKFTKLTLDYSQKYAPIRVKAIHIVNNALLFNGLFQIFKRFLGPKWSKRIHFHGSELSSLTKHIDADRLPTELGGSAEYPEYDGSVLVDFVAHYQPLFDDLNSYGYVDKSNEKMPLDEA